jgi:hypothetical protein
MLTPEVAARVARDYLLPMFERSSFHHTREISKQNSLKRGDSNEGTKTIYEDLKVTV